MTFAQARVERTHVDQSVNPSGITADDQLLDQFHVRPLESAATETALIENTNQIDRDVMAFQRSGQRIQIVGIGLSQSNTGNKRHVTRAGGITRRNRDVMPIRRKTPRQMAADEPGSAQNENFHEFRFLDRQNLTRFPILPVMAYS